MMRKQIQYIISISVQVGELGENKYISEVLVGFFSGGLCSFESFGNGGGGGGGGFVIQRAYPN